MIKLNRALRTTAGLVDGTPEERKHEAGTIHRRLELLENIVDALFRAGDGVVLVVADGVIRGATYHPGEALIGPVNGTNRDWALNFTPIEGLGVYLTLNGQIRHESDDYRRSGRRVHWTGGVVPAATDNVRAWGWS